VTELRQRVARTAATALAATANGLDRLSDRLGDARRTAAFLAGHLQFAPRSDDIYIATYPRSGTTWMQYMLHLLIRDDSDGFEHIGEVSPWFERSLAIGSMRARDFERFDSPRIFKTHLVPRWLPSTGRFVWIVRDVVDVAVSYFQFHRRLLGFEGDEAEFLEAFVGGRLQYGSWHDHTARWRSPRPGQQVLPIRYEDLVADAAGTLRAVADFLALSPSDERIAAVVRQASFDNMKRLEAKFDHATAVLLERGMHRGGFIRRGPASGPSSPPEGWDTTLRGKAADRPSGPIRLPLFLH
jgi:hypothetical protein